MVQQPLFKHKVSQQPVNFLLGGLGEVGLDRDCKAEAEELNDVGYSVNLVEDLVCKVCSQAQKTLHEHGLVLAGRLRERYVFFAAALLVILKHVVGLQLVALHLEKPGLEHVVHAGTGVCGCRESAEPGVEQRVRSEVCNGG